MMEAGSQMPRHLVKAVIDMHTSSQESWQYDFDCIRYTYFMSKYYQWLFFYLFLSMVIDIIKYYQNIINIING